MATRLPLRGPGCWRYLWGPPEGPLLCCIRGLISAANSTSNRSAAAAKQQQQQQQQQQPRGFSRFSRGGRGSFSAPPKPLSPKPSSRDTANPKSSSKHTASPKPFDREAALRQHSVSGSDSLFAECLAALRRRRWELGETLEGPSETIEELSRQEKEIVNKLMQRTEQETKASDSGIDAFWDPMTRVEGLEAQVAQDFEEFTKLVGAAEARRQRLLLRNSLKKAAKLHDPLSEERSNYFGQQETEAPPMPHRRPERFWDPSATLRSALKNKNLPITWKDLHLLHNFVGSNGLLLPRRLTGASRMQQRFIFKAVNSARRMGLFPYDRKPSEAACMPLMDPIQFLVDELTHRAASKGDLRAEAMLRVLMERFPKLNYYRFLQLQARWKKEGRSERPEAKPQPAFQSLFKP